MDFDNLWKIKKITAMNTIQAKEKIHGIFCQVEILKQFKDKINGEESGEKEYLEAIPMKLLFTGLTGATMYSASTLLSNTEFTDVFLKRFEDDALPRNTRIKIFQNTPDSYRYVEVRDITKMEGTFIVLQQLVPTIVVKESFNEALGNNIVDASIPIGNNLI